MGVNLSDNIARRIYRTWTWNLQHQSQDFFNQVTRIYNIMASVIKNAVTKTHSN